MGLFSSIGKVFKKAAPIVGGIIGGPAGAAIGAAPSLFGTSAKEMAAGTLSYEGGKDARELQIAQALRQMQFQEASSARQFARTKELAKTAYDRSRYLSDTAWQRGMADMKAAGLNPILAYKQGPASTPSIQMGNVGLQSGAMANINDIMTPAISTATQVREAQATVQKVQAEEKLAVQRAKESVAVTKLRGAEKDQVYKNIEKIGKEILNIEQTTRLNNAGADLKELEVLIRNEIAKNVNVAGFENLNQMLSGVARKIVDGYRIIGNLLGLDAPEPGRKRLIIE